MKQVKLLSASMLVAMMILTLIVTIGVTLALFPAIERTSVFYLSAAMILIAEAMLFSWPIYHALTPVDRRSPSFVFGLGLQSVFGVYMVGVLLLATLGHLGATEYGLVTNFIFGSNIKFVGATASGNNLKSNGTYDGLRNSQLVSHQSIDAGAVDEYNIRTVVTVPQGLPIANADCTLEMTEAGTGLMISLAVSSGTNSLSVKDCVPAYSGIPGFQRPSIEPTLGVLAVTLNVDGGPRQVSGSHESYELIYRINVRSLNSIGSLKTLGILHSIWALCLSLVLLSWRMGSQFVSGLDEQRKESSQSYSKFRTALRIFCDRVVTENQPGFSGLSSKLGHLNEEARYFASDTPGELESFDKQLMAALADVETAYSQCIAGAGSVIPSMADLNRKLAEITALLKQRDNAIREAR